MTKKPNQGGRPAEMYVRRTVHEWKIVEMNHLLHVLLMHTVEMNYMCREHIVKSLHFEYVQLLFLKIF